MNRHRVAESARIAAPPARVYQILADYREHERILPRKHFKSLVIERGGVGAGTVIAVEMRVLGSTQRFRAEVSEPSPGRVLAEMIIGSGVVTTFTVAPTTDGRATDLTIATELTDRRGFGGMVERFISRKVLPPIYVAELKEIDRYAVANPVPPKDLG
jgi:hypothetical protein